jgi:thioredoxin 1
MRVVEENNFEKEVRDKDVIVQISADWCTPCQLLSPVLQDVAEHYAIDVFKVNIDNCPSVVKKYSIRSLPRIIFIKDGLVADELSGNQDRNKLETTIKEVYGGLV